MFVLLQVLYSSHNLRKIYLKQLYFMFIKHMAPPTDGAVTHKYIPSVCVWNKIYFRMYMLIKLLPQW